MNRVVLILALTGLAACAPSQRRLLRGHHYEEALVALERGVVDEAAVLAAIEGALEVGMHMQAVPAAALRAQLPGQPAVAEELALVRVIHDANEVPLQRFELSLSLLQGDSLFPPLAASRPVLAALTGETLPDATVIEHPGTTTYKRIGFLQFLGRLTLNIVTVGLIHDALPLVPSTRTSGYSETIEPGVDDYMRASPVAESLWRWIEPTRCDGGALDRCRFYLLWRRPPVGAAVPVELAVSVTLGGTSDAAILYRFAIPAGTLEQGLAQMFGDRVRSLAELHRRFGRSRVAVHSLDVLEPDPHGAGHALRVDHERLAQIVHGTRHRPGLRGRAGLRFILAAPRDRPLARDADNLRVALLALGISPEQFELQDVVGPPLRVRYELPPLSAASR